MDYEKKQQLISRRDNVKETLSFIGRSDSQGQKELRRIDDEVGSLDVKRANQARSWAETRETYWPFEPPEGCFLSTLVQKAELDRQASDLKAQIQVMMESLSEAKVALEKSEAELRSFLTQNTEPPPVNDQRRASIQSSSSTRQPRVPTLEDIQYLRGQIASIRETVLEYNNNVGELQDTVRRRLGPKTPEDVEATDQDPSPDDPTSAMDIDGGQELPNTNAPPGPFGFSAKETLAMSTRLVQMDNLLEDCTRELDDQAAKLAAMAPEDSMDLDLTHLAQSNQALERRIEQVGILRLNMLMVLTCPHSSKKRTRKKTRGSPGSQR